MSYESAAFDGLFVVRWGPKPAAEDVERYAAELAIASHRQQRPLVGLFIMPRDSGTPDESFRRVQATHLPKIMSYLSFAVAVFEGEGFISSLKRSALVAILLLAPKKYAIFVRPSVEEALLTNPPGPISFNPRAAIAELERRGLLQQAATASHSSA